MCRVDRAPNWIHSKSVHWSELPSLRKGKTMAKKGSRQTAAFKSRRSYTHGGAFRTLFAADYPLPIRAHCISQGAAVFPVSWAGQWGQPYSSIATLLPLLTGNGIFTVNRGNDDVHASCRPRKPPHCLTHRTSYPSFPSNAPDPISLSLT